MPTTHLEPTATATADCIADATTARTLANRSNAQSSTGPRTDAGKDRVRRNALQHGIYASDVVIPGEDLAAYNALGSQLRALHLPLDPAAEELVQNLQDAQWRLKRIVQLENRMHAYCAAREVEPLLEEFGPLDPDTLKGFASAAGYRANSRLFEQLHRQEGRLRRLIDKTLRELDAPLASSAEPAPLPIDSASERIAAAPIGFVPAICQTPLVPAASPVGSPSKMPKFSGPQAAQHRKNWLRKQKQLGNVA